MNRLTFNPFKVKVLDELRTCIKKAREQAKRREVYPHEAIIKEFVKDEESLTGQLVL